MRWEDERYVRLYTRDTIDWLGLSFIAQGLLCLILRKVDRAGLLKLGKPGKRGVAIVIGHSGDWPRLEPALEELLVDGCIQIRGEYLVVPNFIEAQEAVMSDRQRKAESRGRARDLASAAEFIPDILSRNGTSGHDSGQKVTPGHVESQVVTPSHAVPSRTGPSVPASELAVGVVKTKDTEAAGSLAEKKQARDEEAAVASSLVEKPETSKAVAQRQPGEESGNGLRTTPSEPDSSSEEVLLRPCLTLGRCELPDEDAAVARAELEERLRAGYARIYQKGLEVARSRDLERTVSTWTAAVHELGQQVVVEACVDDAAAYWRRTSGDRVDCLAFFNPTLEKLLKTKRRHAVAGGA